MLHLFVLDMRAHFVVFLFSRCHGGRIHLDTLCVKPMGELDSGGGCFASTKVCGSCLVEGLCWIELRLAIVMVRNPVFEEPDYTA